MAGCLCSCAFYFSTITMFCICNEVVFKKNIYLCMCVYMCVYIYICMYAWAHGLRVGMREVSQRKIEVLLPRGTRRGNGRRAGQAELPSPTPQLHPMPVPRGASLQPTSSWPGQGGTRRYNLIPLAYTSQRSAFLSGSLLTYVLCFHRIFFLLILLVIPER